MVDCAGFAIQLPVKLIDARIRSNYLDLICSRAHIRTISIIHPKRLTFWR